MNQNMIIDVDDKGMRLMIQCPMWANELVRDLPSRRWSKAHRAWAAPIIKQNVIALQRLMRLAGVTVTDDARVALVAYEKKAADMGKRNAGFPAWYKFKTEPLAHQRRALDKGYGLKAYGLFMDMQTGKTKVAIDLLGAHRMEGHILGALVLVKLSLRLNWVKQFGIHCPIPYSIHLPGTGKIRDFDKWMQKGHDFPVLIAGWESLSAGGMAAMCEKFLLHLAKSATVGDETSYITNHKAARTERTVSYGRMSEYRYALTGTPATEGPMNLYSQFEYLDPEIIGIGDYYAYRNRYAIMGGYQREIRPGLKQPTEIVGYQNLDELMGMIAPFTFQAFKAEEFDLPPKRYETRTVELTKEQRSIYQQIKGDGTLNVKGAEAMVLQNVLEVALRLHQVTGGYAVKPRPTTRRKKDGTDVIKMEYDPIELVAPANNPKMMELCAVVEEFRKRKQGIIWAVYQPEIQAIVGLLKKMGLRIGELHGRVDEKARQPMVDEFQRGGLDVVVGNASTGGMGYTMFASEVNVFYNNTFKAIDRIQAEDRSYGIGQTKSGIWIDIVAERTVDVTVIKALERKEDLSTYVRHRITEATKLLDGE